MLPPTIPLTVSGKKWVTFQHAEANSSMSTIATEDIHHSLQSDRTTGHTTGKITLQLTLNGLRINGAVSGSPTATNFDISGDVLFQLSSG